MNSTKNTLRPRAIRHNELCLKNRFYQELTLYHSINTVNADKIENDRAPSLKRSENKNELKKMGKLVCETERRREKKRRKIDFVRGIINR